MWVIQSHMQFGFKSRGSDFLAPDSGHEDKPSAKNPKSGNPNWYPHLSATSAGTLLSHRTRHPDPRPQACLGVEIAPVLITPNVLTLYDKPADAEPAEMPNP
jgi:hypothetical protein